MPVIVSNIIPRRLVAVAQTTQYTAVSCKTIIDKFTVTNVHSGPVTFTVNLPANLQAVGVGNQVLRNKVVAVNETYNCPELVGQMLEPGGFISTLASVDSALVISASGREIT